jgi:hypothetical protein
MLDAISALIATQRNKPLSILVAVLALFAPASLTIFLANPRLFATLGVAGVILLSVAISLPIVMLCYAIWWTPLTAILKILRALQGQGPETDLLRIVTAEDPLEWPCLLGGAWSANVILFVIALISYFHPIRIGATFILTAAILLAFWFLALIATVALDAWIRRRLRESLARLVAAIDAASQASSKEGGVA